MEVIMATTNPSPTSRKFNFKSKVFIIENILIYTAIVGAAGFYFGTQYSAHQQASTKAAVQNALKAVQPAPAAVAEASKN
jgi:hypothetical protein